VKGTERNFERKRRLKGTGESKRKHPRKVANLARDLSATGKNRKQQVYCRIAGGEPVIRLVSCCFCAVPSFPPIVATRS